VHLNEPTQNVGPVQPMPPHCAYCAAPVPVLVETALEDVVVALVDVVVALVDVEDVVLALVEVVNIVVVVAVPVADADPDAGQIGGPG